MNTPPVDPLSPSPPERADVTSDFDGAESRAATPDLRFLQPPSRPDSIGRLGHFEVLEVLGKGGFGIVFRAFDEQLQRVVAVKVLAPQLATTSPARKRFLREARAGAAIRHDNVVQIYAVEEQPVPYLVMEFVPGETLEQRLNRIGPLELPDVLRLGRQMCEGLTAAHTTGLIHRDVKPSNVLIEMGVKERVKLTDFGLARAADDASISQTGVVVGTPLYMSPEQAAGGPLDHRTDLFSLGSVLYAMVTGRPPFRAATTLAILKRVAEEKPRPISEIIPETPAWLCDLIARLHAKNPRDRFQPATEVAELLAQCEAGMTPVFTPVARRGLWSRGRRWLATGAVAAACVLVSGLGVFLLDRMQRGSRESGGRPEGTPIAASPRASGSAPVSPPPAAGQPSYKNIKGMELVRVPRGRSWLGGGGGTPGQRDVNIPYDYYLGQYEVTQEQWQAVMGTNPSRFSRRGASMLVKDFSDEELRQFPVEMVSWDDAQEFVRTLNEQAPVAGWIYRLPTLVEWEYACRGGPLADKTDSAWDYYLLQPSNVLRPDQGNVGSHERELGRTCKVGSYPPNRLGLHDMHGNVFEWCHDARGQLASRRGGTYAHGADVARAAHPSDHVGRFGVPDTGFRVVLVPAAAGDGTSNVLNAP